MSHKVHPKAMQIRNIKDWLSRGFYNKNFPSYLEQDYLIRSYLNKKLPPGSVEEIMIERSQTVLKIIITTSRPALIIGRGGKGVEDLKENISKVLVEKQKKSLEKKEIKSDIKIEIFEVKNPWVSASLIAQWVQGQIERKFPFRRVLKMAISKIMENKEIKGAKIEISGRLNGVEISRREWLKKGRLPRQSLRSIIDYGFKEAHC
ncbi:30S ribosomal protein S3, partial [Candidatus Gribaldobacteria bacterium]|nr:30S ribosomal protein S3 [Candidatus Gribaldobacteria bacterium]